MKTYEVITHELFNYQSIKCTDENGVISFIPMDESNSDYQQYLNPTEHLQTIVPMEGAN